MLYQPFARKQLRGEFNRAIVALFVVLASSITALANRSVALAWDPNSDSLTAGYFLRTEDGVGNLLSRSDVGASTGATVSGLVEGNTYVFSVTAYDSKGNESLPSNKVSQEVARVYVAPTADSKTAQTSINISLPVVLTGSDPNGLPLTFQVVGAPTRGTLIGAAPNLTYVPNSGFYGNDSFTYVANNGQLSSAPATVSVAVIVSAPVADSKSVQTSVNKSVAVTLSGRDPNGLPLTYQIVGIPQRGTLSGLAPNLTYTPANNFYGTDSFTYRVSNGITASSLATVSISVVATPPVAATISAETTLNQAVAVQLSGTSPNGLPLTYRILAGPARGTLSGVAPNLTYTPANNYYGTDSFSYRVNDGLFDSETAQVTVSVTATPPVADSQSTQTMQTQPVSILLTGSDPSGRAVSFRIVSQPSGGTLTGTAPDLVYTPHDSFKGSDSFTFVVNNGIIDSEEATVGISVAQLTGRVKVRRR